MFEKTLKNPQWRKKTAENIKFKAKKVGREVAGFLPFMAIWMAVDGCVTANHNERRIEKLERHVWEHGRLINQHADAGNAMAADLKVLVDNHESLYQEALDATEGVDKETEEKEETVA